MSDKGTAVILFDGVCNFCNGAVQFIIKRDRKAYFRFASLQSDVGKRLLADHPELQGIDSIVLMEAGKCYIESAAALRIARHLDGLWRAAALLHAVPQGFRDPLYRFVARHRYRWFGKAPSCIIPTAEMRDRFLSVD